MHFEPYMTGMNGFHVHPLEPFQVRGSFTAHF